ncbi:flagellar hook assembly protein FlgD [Allokutzneria albata]|uniref:Uncharacterized protein n=1 Tax=Allokutzneria albata TaxID=211114 RepID=A0A1H0DUU8_ALLAB|nr:hypothetical protein [Allokutzneria albata]SDN73793.1 hypothetical protein SAMN04489726_8001 [Allokutzneria albata]
MMLTRVARTAAAVLEHTFTVGETGTNSTTPVTVTITDANGDVVDTGTATADPGVDGRYTFALEPQAALADLTVAWAGTVDGAAVVETDRVEIVGGFFFTLTALRNSDSSLESTDKYPTADLVRVRLEVEQECEEICDQSFVRRYRREVLNGTGSTDLVLPDAGVRTIRSVRVSPRVGLPFVGFTEAQLAALVVTDDRVLRRVDDNVWLPGLANVVVEYEHHGRELPVDLQRAALTRARTRLNIARSGIPDRAESFTAVDGGTYRLSLPSAYRTGIPEVDAVYARYSLRVGQDEDGAAGSGSRPASRMLSHDPQYYSLFHGGRR